MDLSRRLPALLLGILVALTARVWAWQQMPNLQISSRGPEHATLDYNYFKDKVEPVFLAKRSGHARCVACHSSNNSPLRLQPLDKGSSTWTEEESRKNFEAVQKVARSGDLESPLLIHPLAEQAGGDFFHGGGKHFNSQSDPEWMALKAWIMGAAE